MVDGCGDARTAGGIIGPFYQPGFGRISNAGATDSTRGGGAMRGLRSSTRPFNLRTTIDLLVIAGGAAGRAA